MAQTQKNEFARALARVGSDAQPASPAGQVTVKPGDTLSGIIARQLKLGGHKVASSPAQLAAWSAVIARHNRMADPNKIYPGQVIDLRPLPEQVALHRGAKGAYTAAPTIAASGVERTGQPPRTGFVGDTVAALAPPAVEHDARQQKPTRTVIVGDSIALGIGRSVLNQGGVRLTTTASERTLNHAGRDVAVNAQVGANSAQVLRQVQQRPDLKDADLAVLSVGTNDLADLKTGRPEVLQRVANQLREIRATVQSTSTVWILPYDKQARELVQQVARQNQDQTLDLSEFQAADSHHPKSYTAVAQKLSQVTGLSWQPSPAAAAKQTLWSAETLALNQTLSAQQALGQRERLNPLISDEHARAFQQWAKHAGSTE